MVNGECTSTNRYIAFDALKCVCAFLVVCTHSPFPGSLGIYFNAVCRIAVPLFFMITGFFFETMQKKGKINNQIKKICKLVIFSNMFYLILNLFFSLKNGDFPNGILRINLYEIKSWFHVLVLDQSPVSGHLWYLMAVLVLLCIRTKLNKFFKSVIFNYIMIGVLLFLYLAMSTYSKIIFGRSFSWAYATNFLIPGLPYFLLGELVFMYRKWIEKISLKMIVVINVCFLGLSLLEIWLLYEFNLYGEYQFVYFFTIGNVICTFLIAYKLSFRDYWIVKKLALIGKNTSTGIYIIHMAVLTILSNYGLFASILGNIYECLRPFIVFVVSILLSYVWNLLYTKKNPSNKLLKEGKK